VGGEVPGDASGLPAGVTVGSRLAGYLLEEQVGEGGMAVVFRARDERLDRLVALKVLSPALAADADYRQRFLRESRAAAAVDDPHIIPVYEAGEAGGVLFIAMRYVPGRDVRTLLRREGTLSAGRAAAIISAVASALDAAHAAGLVHRDVKPANMLMDARPGRPDHVYLSDFGLSKPALAATGLTHTGQFLGTLDYVAPEQLGGQPVDGRSDQYALACAAFELLAGSPPFHREDGLAVMYGHISQPPPPLTSQRPDLPAAADQVLARALAKAPAERYATCCDFADALRGSLGLPPYAQVPGEVAAQSGQAGRPASTRTVIWSGQDAGDAAAPGDAVVPGDAAAPGEDAAPGKAVQDEEGEEAGAAGRGQSSPVVAATAMELPTGTLTMLFTDIEGSTVLVRRLGERYGDALSAQRTLLRAAFRSFGGRELSTEGDSFFVVFESAIAAVGCCVAGQRALAGHDWPDGATVRVRMGLHSGEPTRHEDNYVGLDVHRAARIAAAAHGGQVVLSDATRHLVESRLAADVSLRDLGWHRLKDIEAPERIYQLVVAGLPDRFPSLKSLGAPSRLPVPMTPLVGRERDLENVLATLTGAGTRLVTLTGTGGVGKTRLSLAAAAALDQDFPQGVFFIPLAAVRDAEVMWKTIADGLDVAADGPAAAAVTGYLRDRRALLVLDNLEQLDGAAGVVGGLLAAAPGLVVLATSRRLLHLPGEQELPVPPLQVPREASVEEVSASGAARLFVQQASMSRPGFTLTAANSGDIAAICERLDGLPLAIELAAARIRLLAPRALLARLGHSIDLAAPDVGQSSRQQTLRNAIAWSYDLLTPDLAEAFRRAGVFAGGCDLDALAAVAAPEGAGADPLDLAAGLLDVSLVTVTDGADGEPRVGMLETIREYALERLERAGDLDDTRHRHAEHYAGVAERADEQLRNSGPTHLAALDRLEAEHDNLRAALAWSLQTPAAGQAPADRERAAIGLRLAQALAYFWYRHGYAAEGRRWLQGAIDLAAEDGGAPLAQVAHWLGVLLQMQSEPQAAVPLLERSLAIWRDLGDRDQQARELNSLGITYHHLDDPDTARSLLEESAAISREVGSDFRLAAALTNLGQLEADAGNFDRATQVLQEALAIDTKQGDMLGVALDQQSLAGVHLRAGRGGEARDLLSAMAAYVVSSSDPELLATTLEMCAANAAQLGEGPRAARLAGAAEAVRQKTGIPIKQPELLEEFLVPARAATDPKEWDAALAAGRALTQEQAATLLTSPPTPST
jgi:predicted ATPase/class 3 adenylate cyclase